MEPPGIYGRNSNKYDFPRKLAVVSEEVIVIGSLFEMFGAATGKTRFPILNLVLGTEVVWMRKI